MNKPARLTSFQALAPVKRALKTEKVGHTGTLDKFAKGLMIVLAGGALKLAPLFTNCDKHYEAEIFFGAETDTLDPEGVCIAEAPAPKADALLAALDQFRGEIRQHPPLYSAVHIQGRRAHEIARAGGTALMPARSVSIYELQLLDYSAPKAKIAVHCSSGTYIRSLARDIALATGSRAHLLSLIRTAVGAFSLCDAVIPESHEKIRAALRPVDKTLFQTLNIPTLDIDEEAARAVQHGQRLDNRFDTAPEISLLALFYGGKLAALIERSGDKWSYRFVSRTKL